MEARDEDKASDERDKMDRTDHLSSSVSKVSVRHVKRSNVILQYNRKEKPEGSTALYLETSSTTI